MSPQTRFPVARWFLSQPAAMFYCLAMAARYESLGSPSGRPAVAATLAHLFFPFSMALWVLADARQRRRSLPYDFDTFLFFAWPVIVPIYLFRTRGWRAFATCGWFLLLYLAAVICGGIPSIVEAMREE